MSNKFQAGDKVKVIGGSNPRRIGVVFTIITGPVTHCSVSGNKYRGSTPVYEIDDESEGFPGTFAGYSEWYLELYDNDEDLSQNELMKVTSWDDCVFQPKELVVTS